MIPLIGGIQNRQIDTDKKWTRGYPGLGGEGNGKLLFQSIQNFSEGWRKFWKQRVGDACAPL